MKTENQKCTFIASIRVDLRDIAAIAQFLDDKGIFVETRAKIASEAIRIIARGCSEKFHVKSHIEALNILNNLEYDSSNIKGTRYYSSLVKEISEERSQENIDEVVKTLVKEKNEQPSSMPPPDSPALDSIMAPEGSEPPQTRERTPKDESKDLRKLRSAMTNLENVQVLEEKTIKVPNNL